MLEKISNLMKIRSVGWGSIFSMRTDGRADGRTEEHEVANSRFSQFCKCVSKAYGNPQQSMLSFIPNIVDSTGVV
jgi:hypothetical protein